MLALLACKVSVLDHCPPGPRYHGGKRPHSPRGCCTARPSQGHEGTCSNQVQAGQGPGTCVSDKVPGDGAGPWGSLHHRSLPAIPSQR